jgi:hypothetical protein
MDSPLPGWIVTHGHPHKEVVHDQDAFCESIFIEDSGPAPEGCGHGVAATFTFEPGGEYVIAIALCNANLSTGVLNVRLTENMPSNRQWAGCCDAIPTNNLGANSWVTSTNTFNAYKEYHVTIPGNANFNYLWIYPEKVLPTGGNTMVWLDNVQIYRKCKKNLFASGNFIQPKSYSYYQYIYGGSVYGSNPSGLAATDPSGTTTFTASEQITIDNNFIATINHGQYVLMNIEKKCSIVAEEDAYAKPGSAELVVVQPKNGIGRSHNGAGSQQQIDNKAARQISSWPGKGSTNGIRIYPNPATDHLTLEVSPKGVFDVRVIDAVGSTKYAKQISGNNKHAIDVGELPPGNYLIRVVGEGLNHTERISVIR